LAACGSQIILRGLRIQKVTESHPPAHSHEIFYPCCPEYSARDNLHHQLNNIFAALFLDLMISVDSVGVEFSGTVLFNDLVFNINEDDRIALMGKNGAGKSTLLKILAGVNKPTYGKISAPKDSIIAYLPQHLLTEDNCTVFEEASKAFSKIHSMKAKMDELNKQLETRTDYESDEYAKIIEEVSELSEKFYSIEEVNYDAEVEKTLMGLGFLRSDFTRSTSEFSGGWRMRIELVKILLQKPDLILLDEPTNHLDIESVQWLEEFLKTNAKAVIVISHDKAFVDNLTNRTIEITMGRIYDYKTNYSHYLQLRKERREQQQKQFDDQQKEIADITQFIERFKGTYSKTLQVQSRVKMLDKIKIVEVDEVDTSALNLKFPPAPRSGSYPAIVEGFTKRYGDHVVLNDVSLTIARGDKVAFVGKNGEGKSTLVKAMMGEIDFEGRLQMGHNSMIGYFAQNQASLLDVDLTVFQTIDQIAEGEIRTKIKDILGAFLFSGDNIEKKVKVLSGGERTRLAMIKLLLQPVNLLILDEPTNHLDIKTKDILKDALKAFDGTLILVSHDRDFLDGLATKAFEFGNKKIKEHFEDINGFLRNKKMENLKEIERVRK
jgi:ATP-binding cassette, subfamily F, member 3